MENKVSNLLLELLTEARRKDLPYTEKKTKGAIDKVIVELSGKESEKFTKLASKFKNLRKKTDELSAETDNLNREVKDLAIDLFDATDEVYTRIVETVSMTISISKREPDSLQRTEKVDYEKIIKEIQALVPGLSDKIDEIIKANTEVKEEMKTAKAPQLRVKMNEGLGDDVIKFLKNIGKRLIQSVRPWAREFDRKAKDIKKRIEALPDTLAG